MIIERRRLCVCRAGVLLKLSIDRLLKGGNLFDTFGLLQRPLLWTVIGFKGVWMSVVLRSTNVVHDRPRAGAPRFRTQSNRPVIKCCSTELLLRVGILRKIFC